MGLVDFYLNCQMKPCSLACEEPVVICADDGEVPVAASVSAVAASVSAVAAAAAAKGAEVVSVCMLYENS